MAQKSVSEDGWLRDIVISDPEMTWEWCLLTETTKSPKNMTEHTPSIRSMKKTPTGTTAQQTRRRAPNLDMAMEAGLAKLHLQPRKPQRKSA